MLSSSGLEADKGKQREKQREREIDRDRDREHDWACPSAWSCAPCCRASSPLPGTLIGLRTTYLKRRRFGILNWRNLRNSNCGKDSLTFPWCMHAQLCLTLCGSTDCSLPGSSVRGIFQARILEWIAIPYSGDFPDPGTEPTSLASPALAGGFFTSSVTCEPFVPEAGHKTLTWRGALHILGGKEQPYRQRWGWGWGMTERNLNTLLSSPQLNTLAHILSQISTTSHASWNLASRCFGLTASLDHSFPYEDFRAPVSSKIYIK